MLLNSTENEKENEWYPLCWQQQHQRTKYAHINSFIRTDG